MSCGCVHLVLCVCVCAPGVLRVREGGRQLRPQQLQAGGGLGSRGLQQVVLRHEEACVPRARKHLGDAPRDACTGMVHFREARRDGKRGQGHKGLVSTCDRGRWVSAARQYQAVTLGGCSCSLEDGRACRAGEGRLRLCRTSRGSVGETVQLASSGTPSAVGASLSASKVSSRPAMCLRDEGHGCEAVGCDEVSSRWQCGHRVGPAWLTSIGPQPLHSFQLRSDRWLW
jgi:hypothetical protein